MNFLRTGAWLQLGQRWALIFSTVLLVGSSALGLVVPASAEAEELKGEYGAVEIRMDLRSRARYLAAPPRSSSDRTRRALGTHSNLAALNPGAVATTEHRWSNGLLAPLRH